MSADTPVDAGEVADLIRVAVLAALHAADSAPITTTYTGLGSLAWDDCCGTLTATPERVYRSQRPPAETVAEDCYGGELMVQVLVQLVRCVPVLSDTGAAPTSEALGAANQEIHRDAAIVWNTLATATLPSDEWGRYGPVDQATVGADGGCVEVSTRVLLSVGVSEWTT